MGISCGLLEWQIEVIRPIPFLKKRRVFVAKLIETIKMKRYITLLGFVFFTISICMAYDHIIFRNGRETDVKLYQITDDKIIFAYIGDKTGTQHEVASKDVFMVYIEKQGNVYITPDGKRFTGEPKRADAKRNDVIYLIRGGEIAADNIKITENNIHYSIKHKGSGIKGLMGKGNISEAVLAKSDVFMVRYKSGMSDIITPIEIVEKSVSDTATVENQQPQFIVIFHAVSKGENLEKLSSKYNVTPKQIIEWNDLPQKTKPTSPLTTGMQLMIYQPKK